MEMSLSLLRNDLNTSEQHRLVRAVRNTFNGSPSGTPTPNILRFQDIGLLYFLNEKQSKFHRVIASVDLDAHETLLPVRNLVTFVTTAVGWLIVEAERIDEAIIATQRELSNLGNELREKDMDLQYQSSHTGTEVIRAIAEHHRTRVNVPQRRHPKGVSQQFDQSQLAQIGDLPEKIVELRSRFQAAKAHLKVLRTSQRLLHGNKNAEVPQVEAEAIVADLSCLTTFRKAAHKVRDSVFGVPNREKMEAISSLLEVFAYLDRGLTAALDDLEHCQMHLKKGVLLGEKQTRLDHLDEVDARNKQLSSAALRHNEEMGQEISRAGGASAFQHHAAGGAGGAGAPMSYLHGVGSGLVGHDSLLTITDNSPIHAGPPSHAAASPGSFGVAEAPLGNPMQPYATAAPTPQPALRGGNASFATRGGATGPKAAFISPGGAFTPNTTQHHMATGHHLGANHIGAQASPASDHRGVSVSSHTSEMEEFLQLYCS